MKNSLYHIIQLAAFIIAMHTYRGMNIRAMRGFLPFLGFVLFSELVARYQGSFLNLPTIYVNYIVAVAELLFYGLFFYRVSNHAHYKTMILVFMNAGFSAYLYAGLVHGNHYFYFFTAFSLSGLFLTVMAMGYLYLKFAEDIGDLLTDPACWIAFGVALFFSGVSIVFSMYDLIRRYNICLWGDRLYRVIPQLFSMVLYSFISISLLICAKKNT